MPPHNLRILIYHKFTFKKKKQFTLATVFDIKISIKHLFNKESKMKVRRAEPKDAETITRYIIENPLRWNSDDYRE